MGDEKSPSVIVLRDNALRRDCLARALSTELTIPVHGAHAVDDIAAMASLTPSLIIFDLGAKALTTPEARRQTDRLRALFGDTALVVFCDRIDPATLVEATAARLNGLIATTETLEVAVAAIHLVLAGGVYYSKPEDARPDHGSRPVVASDAAPGAGSSAIGEQFADQPAAPEIDPVAVSRLSACHFTSREQQVLDCLQLGLSNKGIAHRLNLSENTVKVHLHRIMRKLSVTNRTEAALSYTRTRSAGGEPGEDRPLACLPGSREIAFQLRKNAP